MAEFPILETERLTLRPPAVTDFPSLRKMWDDPLVMKYIAEGKPLTRQQGWERLMRNVGHWHVNGYGPWVLIEKTSGDFVGLAGYLNLMRDIIPPLDGKPEVGWTLASSFHGKGMASEALQEILRWGDNYFKEAPVSCCIMDPRNLPSLKLAEKLGFKVILTTTYSGHPSYILERPSVVARRHDAYDTAIRQQLD